MNLDEQARYVRDPRGAFTTSPVVVSSFPHFSFSHIPFFPLFPFPFRIVLIGMTALLEKEEKRKENGRKENSDKEHHVFGWIKSSGSKAPPEKGSVGKPVVF